MISFIMHHKLIVIVIGLLVAGAAWFGLSQGPATDALLTTETISDEGPDKDLVSTLLALRAVQLEGAIFSDQAFISLKDFSTQIIPEPIGRQNPFAPLGASAAPTSTTTQGAQIFTPGANVNGGR
jgi:hypothetical protein